MTGMRAQSRTAGFIATLDILLTQFEAKNRGIHPAEPYNQSYRQSDLVEVEPLELNPLHNLVDFSDLVATTILRVHAGIRMSRDA